jgi:hypothetical protein
MPTPSQCSDFLFPQPNENPDYLLCDLQLYGLPEGPVEFTPASQMSSLF